MGGMGSGRSIEIVPKSKAAKRLIESVERGKPGRGTLAEIARVLRCHNTALTRWLKGQRAMPLRIALKIEELFGIAPEEWLE